MNWLRLNELWFKRYHKCTLLINATYFVKSLDTVTRLIQITVEFQFHYFVLILINTDTFNYAYIMASIPSEISYNNNWLKIHYYHCFQGKYENINSIIIGDTQYSKTWKNLFGNRFINLGISWDGIENVLRRARDVPFLPPLLLLSAVQIC